MTIAPTAPQQNLHPAQETEYLEVGFRDILYIISLRMLRVRNFNLAGDTSRTSNFSDLNFHKSVSSS